MLQYRDVYAIYGVTMKSHDLLLQLEGGYIIIPKMMITDLETSNKELSTLSNSGSDRTFPVTLLNDQIKIDYSTTKNSSVSEVYNVLKKGALELTASIEQKSFEKRAANFSFYSSPKNIKGTINGIWLTAPNGTLHPAIIPNLSSMVKETKGSQFEIVLWTNTQEIQKSEVDKLRGIGVVVKDYSLCKTSILYPDFTDFLTKGIKGDKTAFALASDILRMAALELAPDNEYFIYADPNDVNFTMLSRDLKEHLPAFPIQNSLGFSFFVMPMDENSKIIQTRNDVLIALKTINQPFFKDYFMDYAANLDNTSFEYSKPTSDGAAQALARKITMQTGERFFQVTLDSLDRLMVKFKHYEIASQHIHVGTYLQYNRDLENGNTWLPIGKLEEERALSARLGLKVRGV